jgi:hypothetical protein
MLREQMIHKTERGSSSSLAIAARIVHRKAVDQGLVAMARVAPIRSAISVGDDPTESAGFRRRRRRRLVGKSAGYDRPDASVNQGGAAWSPTLA